MTPPLLLQAERDAGLETVTYVTIPDVEIAFVGMEWAAASGPTTLTFEHLSDAVRAANDDPHILPPRAKLGHVDPRFNEEEPIHDPFTYHGMLRDDGSPAYGRYVNLRLENDGASLRGDWIEVPSWLAEAAPSAYPSRSLEGDWDVETPGGKRYSFVLTAVSSLGEKLPAIGCLEDLIRTLTGKPTGDASNPSLSRSTPMATDMAASVDSVIRAFWTDFAQLDRYWWWPVDVWVEPNQVISDDDEGHLYRVPFTTDADGNVTFDEPVRVQQEFRDLPAVAASQKGQLVARFATASSARPNDRVRASAADEPSTKGPGMTDEQKALAQKLGLGEDATEEQLNEKLQSDALAAEDATAASETETEAELETAATADEPAPIPASLVDPSALAQLQDDARLGREAREQQITAERVGIVDERVRVGAIAPSSRDAHLAELQRGGEIEKAHRTYLASLATGVIPVDERGSAGTAAAEDAGLEPVLATFGIRRDRKERN